MARSPAISDDSEEGATSYPTGTFAVLPGTIQTPSEHPFDQLVHHVPLVVWTTDTYLRLVASATTGLGHVELVPSSFIGKTLFEVFDTQNQDSPPIVAHRQALAGNSGHYIFSTPTQQFDVRVEPLHDGGDMIAGCVGMAFDLAEIRQVTQLLAASEARYRAVVEASPDAITMLDSSNVIIFCNRQAATLFGYERPDELLGRNALTLIAPEDHGRAYEQRQQTLAHGISANIEYVMVRKDGSRFPVELSASVVREEESGFSGFISVLHDLSARKQAEELRHAKEVAEQASRAKSEFLSRMSHELRTPLSVILGFAQLLAMDQQRLNPEQRESVEQIIVGGRHLLLLINDVLDISQIEAGHLALRIETMPILDIIQDVLDFSQAQALQKLITIHLEPPIDPEWSVRADQQRLVQVLLNIITNAIKYTPPRGRIVVCCSCEDRLMRVEISDTGPGIPPDKIGKLFTPFERLGAEYTTIEGTGLGLALSKGLMEDMGGSIGVHSTVGQGSTFWITLPMV